MMRTDSRGFGCARPKDALEACVDDLQRASGLDMHGGAFASFDAAVWLGAPEELRLRLLGRMIGASGGQSEPLNLAQLEALVRRLSEKGFEGATLGGAAISRHASAIRVQRELGRAPLPSLELAPGAAGIWDNRFRVRSATSSPGVVEVRALGPDGYAKLRREFELPAAMPASAGATLPAFWRKDEVLFAAVLGDLQQANERWKAARRLYSAEFLK
jgi:tRNA(Ile)-lysidine synthase